MKQLRGNARTRIRIFSLEAGAALAAFVLAGAGAARAATSARPAGRVAPTVQKTEPARIAAARRAAPSPETASEAPLILRVQPDDALTREGFRHFYNMDYDGAIERFTDEEKNHPRNPFVVNHVLEAVLAKELQREGALDAALYMGNAFLKIKEAPIDPRVKTEIGELSRRSLELCNAELAAHPDDPNALYARGVARGLAAVYTALIEKRWLGALRDALGSYHEDRRILRIDPQYADAKLVVGTYQYIIGSLSWWEKTVAYVVDIHGSKRYGLQLLRQAADGGGEASVDAKTILALFLAREKRYADALAIMSRLSAAFPHNFHFALAVGELLAAQGHGEAAVEFYRRMVSLGRAGQFPNARVEIAAESEGRVLREMKNFPAAAAAFEEAAAYPQANSAIVLRATLEAGEMYDLAGQRGAAMEKYRAVIAADGASAEARAARRYLKHPYHG